MSRDVELERILDDWFAVGTDKAPALAVERALAQVAATPRATPLARRWRLDAIPGLLRTPAARLAAILLLMLATVLAVLAGGAGQRSTSSFPSTVTLTPETAVDAPPIPTAPDSSPDLGQTFSSGRYAYSISYPSTWRIIPATADWPGSGSWTSAPSADIVKPLGGDLPFVSVVAIDVPGDASIDDVIEQALPQRPEVKVESDGHRHCAFRTPGGGTMFVEGLGSTEWYPITIDGREVRMRDSCGHVDVLLVAGRRVYVISFGVGRDSTAHPDRGLFARMVGSLSVRPDAPLGRSDGS